MMLDFPNSPIAGQQFTAAGVTWTFDGAKWLPSGLSPLVVPGINDNRIINGDMRIDQRNNGAQGTAIGYTIDRWRYDAAQTGKGSWQRSPLGPNGVSATGCGYNLVFSSSSAYTPLASETFFLNQIIEADTVTDFAWGTPGAQPVTVSFWAIASIAGTYGGSIRNFPTPSTRSYPFSYSIPTVGVWTKIVVTIPGDTAGTWVMSGNAAAMQLCFDVGSGATFRAPAGVWASGNFTGANGAINVVGTNAAALNITGVKLETGNVATPFNRQSLAKSMADCQRYYSNTLNCYYQCYSNVTQFITAMTLPTAMRAPPTLTFPNTTYLNASGIFLPNGATINSFTVGAVATAVGQVGFSSTGITASAEL